MTLYSLYILISIFCCLVFMVQTLLKIKSALEGVIFSGFSLSVVAILGFVFVSKLVDGFIIDSTSDPLFLYQLIALSVFFLLWLIAVQGDIFKNDKIVLTLFAANCIFVETILVVLFLNLPTELPSFFSDFLIVRIALYLSVFLLGAYTYRKFRILAEIEQARISSFFMCILLFFSLVLWVDLTQNDKAFQLIAMLLMPLVWAVSNLTRRENIIRVETFLKKVILKLICLTTYVYFYVFLKFLFLGTADEVSTETSDVFFSTYLLFIFITYSSVLDFFQKICKKYLFRSLINYHLLFQSFSSVILSMKEVNKIADMIVRMFYDAYGIERISLFMKDEVEDVFKLKTAIGIQVTEKKLSQEHIAIKLLKARAGVFNRAGMLRNRNPELEHFLKSIKAEICIPFEARQDLIGVLFLGSKTDGSVYSQEDMEVFGVMAGQISVALSNALFYETERESYELIAQRNKMDTVIALSAGVNHEINNPLSIISMKCQNFIRKINQKRFASEQEILESAKEVIESCLKNAGRAHMITQRLGNFAKPIREDVGVESINLNHFATDCVELVGRKQLESDGIFVHMDIPENNSWIECDKSHLQQILFNLITNAYHAIGTNGNIHILASEPSPDEVCLELRDDGSGIPEDKKDKIWEPFFTTKPGQAASGSRFSGTGLGLPLVKRYIEHSGGRVVVKSAENVGTSFFLYFKKGKKPE